MLSAVRMAATIASGLLKKANPAVDNEELNHLHTYREAMRGQKSKRLKLPSMLTKNHNDQKEVVGPVAAKA